MSVTTKVENFTAKVGDMMDAIHRAAIKETRGDVGAMLKEYATKPLMIADLPSLQEQYADGKVVDPEWTPSEDFLMGLRWAARMAADNKLDL